jgi:hypothetical protein
VALRAAFSTIPYFSFSLMHGVYKTTGILIVLLGVSGVFLGCTLEVWFGFGGETRLHLISATFGVWVVHY